MYIKVAMVLRLYPFFESKNEKQFGHVRAMTEPDAKSSFFCFGETGSTKHARTMEFVCVIRAA